MAGKVDLGDVNRGDVDLDDLMRLNALMDMQEATERRAAERARQK